MHAGLHYTTDFDGCPAAPVLALVAVARGRSVDAVGGHLFISLKVLDIRQCLKNV
jgi:hypothetical protein